MSRHRIALYYPWLYLTSGAERTIIEIARRSRHEVVIFTNRYEPDATFPELRELDVRVQNEVPVRRTIGAVGQAATKILTQRMDLDGFDALLVVCEGLGDLVALRQGDIPSFNLCLTPLRIVFDPVYRAEYLASRGALQRAVIGLGSVGFRLVDRIAWKRYRRVFPISEEVRKRIIAGGLATDEQMKVLNPGIDLDRFEPSETTNRTFFVPGRIMWTKNLEVAIEAFQKFKQHVHEPETWKLVIAGIVDRKSEPYLERLRALAGDDASIEFRIRPPDEEMLEAYRSCFATLFTAFNEDWGLVVIEAMACAKPVVATARGGPLEIVNDGVDGLLAQPDADSFAEKMLQLATDDALRERITKAGPDRAAYFGWDPFVERLDDAIEADLAPRA